MVRDKAFRQLNRLLRKADLELSRVHFYYPIPDLNELDRRGHWEKPMSLPRIDLRDKEQLAFLRDAVSRAGVARRFDRPPARFTYSTRGREDGRLEGISPLDAYVLYTFVHDMKPSRIVEIGAGSSTKVIREAIHDSGAKTQFTTIEPYPAPFLSESAFTGVELIRSPLELVDPKVFASLRAGDILFIDSSHVAKAGSDVTSLFLDILPRLPPGVLIHVHDIYLPWEYPRAKLESGKSWNEQYILAAYLQGGGQFEVKWAAHYMKRQHAKAIQEAVPEFVPAMNPVSFWFRRVEGQAGH